MASNEWLVPGRRRTWLAGRREPPGVHHLHSSRLTQVLATRLPLPSPPTGPSLKPPGRLGEPLGSVRRAVLLASVSKPPTPGVASAPLCCSFPQGCPPPLRSASPSRKTFQAGDWAWGGARWPGAEDHGGGLRFSVPCHLFCLSLGGSQRTGAGGVDSDLEGSCHCAPIQQDVPAEVPCPPHGTPPGLREVTWQIRTSPPSR